MGGARDAGGSGAGDHTDDAPLPRGRRAPARRAVAVAVAAALVLVAGVAATAALATRDRDPAAAPGAAREAPIRVASFDFAESELLGELFTRALEHEGLEVEHVAGMGSREVVAPAIHQGHVDVVPEYLAAALDFESLGAGVPFTATEAARRLSLALDRFGVTVLDHAPAVDRDAIAMHAVRADELGISSVADLAEHDHLLDFVGPAECRERPVCLPRLREEHGVEFRSFTPVEPGLPVALALAADEADVGLMFSTDPLVAEHGLVLLEDRRGRPEHVVPLVRDEVLERHGEPVRAALGRVTAALTTEELVSMNHRVGRGEPVRRVVEDWLASVG